MRRLAAAVVVLALAGATPAAIGAVTGEQLVGVVTPTIGITVDATGSASAIGGTQPATVTREQRGETLVVTVIPAI